MSQVFDASEYVRAPRLSVVHALALVMQLLQRMDEDASEGERGAAKTMRSESRELRVRWKQRERQSPKRDARAVNQANDNAWGGLYDRLTAWTRLSAETVPEAERAQEVIDQVFSRGMGFLKLEHKPQWVESGRVLEVIDEEGLAEEIDALAGAAFLAEVRRTHKAHGDALGLTARVQTTAAAPDLSEPLRAVSDAIVAYAIQVVATVKPRDASTVERARHLLEPIAEHRSRNQAKTSVTDDAGDAANDIDEDVIPNVA